MNRLVLGMDASSTVVAYTGDKDLSQGSMEYDPEEYTADERRLKMYRDVRSLAFSLPRDTVVALEEPLSLRNPKTNIVLSLAAGAVWAAFMHHEVTVIWVNVSSWKKYTVGNGNATKEQVREWCLQDPEFDRNQVFYDAHPDLYDAWAIYRYAKGNLVDGRSS